MILFYEKAKSNNVEQDTSQCHDDHRKREKASRARVRFAPRTRSKGHNSGNGCNCPGDNMKQKHRQEDIVCKGASITDWLVKQEC